MVRLWESGNELTLIINGDSTVTAFYRQVITPDQKVATVGQFTIWYSSETPNYYIKDSKGTIVQTGFSSLELALAWVQTQAPGIITGATIAIAGILLWGLLKEE